MEEGFRQAKCHVVAQIYAVCIWGSLVKFQRGRVVVKFDVFSRCYAAFFAVVAVCMQAMTHSVDNVPSQLAVKLVVVGLGFVEQCWFRLFLGYQLQ